MAEYITIDGGTTNTRLRLVVNHRIVDTVKAAVGARAGIQDRLLLRQTIRDGIRELLSRNQKEEEDITRILASGMITSEFGLVNLPHIQAPAGLKELHETLQEVVLEDITSIPFVFVRGVKTQCSNLDEADMMRGEETEVMGIWEGKESTIILPGSHSKILQVDSMGRIVAFQTMLTGEMIAALSEGTILKDAVALGEYECNKEYLLQGYHMCHERGINTALFKVRVLKNLFGKNASEVYHFYMGVILCQEIDAVMKQHPKEIVIGGKGVIREAMAVLLKALSEAEIHTIPDERAESASALGIVKIYEYAG